MIYSIDTKHSYLEFSIKHMMISKVRGTFLMKPSTLELDPEDWTTAEIDLSVDVKSIDTRNEKRDAHLMSSDFFDAVAFPNMHFTSLEIKAKGSYQYAVTGELSIHGVTKQETFQMKYEGKAKDVHGTAKIGISGSGVIKRSDYGLTYNAALETGGMMLGDEVEITIAIQAIEDRTL
ncbi:YceI family protein [Bacillus sp. 1P06AnD]|uniref:YceI family protein n=1 Tax=Bacillus sp. 1P06AnD TaxID=3132208 RepID=UPI0039A0083C